MEYYLEYLIFIHFHLDFNPGAQLAVLYTYNCLLILLYYWLGPGGMIVLYLCAQLAVLYIYNCLLILIFYRLGQNQLIINKYAVRSRYSLGPIKLN